MFWLLLLIIQLSVRCLECAEHQICFARYNEDFCYTYHGNQNINWTDAEDHCKTNYNGHLASVHTEIESLTMHRLIEEADPIAMRRRSGIDCWIGLHDYISNSTEQWNWKWADMTMFSYTHWSNFLKGPALARWLGKHQDICVEAYFAHDLYDVGGWGARPCQLKRKCFFCLFSKLKKGDGSPVPSKSIVNSSNQRNANWPLALGAVIGIFGSILLICVGIRHFAPNRFYQIKYLIMETVAERMSPRVNKKDADDECPIGVNQ